MKTIKETNYTSPIAVIEWMQPMGPMATSDWAPDPTISDEDHNDVYDGIL